MHIRILMPLLLSAVLTPLALPQNPEISLAVPGRDLSIVLNLPGFAVQQDEKKSDSRRYFYATNSQTNILFSIFVETVPPAATVTGCHEHLQARAARKDFNKKDIRFSDKGEWAVLEYLIHEYDGMPMRQGNLFACRFHDRVFLDVHISKVKYAPEDSAAFLQLLEKIEFRSGAADTPAGKTSLDYWMAGGAAFVKRDYAKAIPPYEKALDLEKKSPALSRDYWFVLVDNLGMAYGITGNLQKAKEIFEYGLSKEKEYPLFYYNLACTYAEMGDLEKTKENLKTAFSYKKNLISGEEMPDPRTDDSFQRFMKDKAFKSFVETLVAAK